MSLFDDKHHKSTHDPKHKGAHDTEKTDTPKETPKARSHGGGFEPFKGDRHNQPGVRCKHCGVVFPDVADALLGHSESCK